MTVELEKYQMQQTKSDVFCPNHESQQHNQVVLHMQRHQWHLICSSEHWTAFANRPEENNKTFTDKAFIDTQQFLCCILSLILIPILRVPASATSNYAIGEAHTKQFKTSSSHNSQRLVL